MESYNDLETDEIKTLENLRDTIQSSENRLEVNNSNDDFRLFFSNKQTKHNSKDF